MPERGVTFRPWRGPGDASAVAVTAGTLDDRSDIKPTVEVWCEHRQPWVGLPGITTSLAREG